MISENEGVFPFETYDTDVTDAWDYSTWFGVETDEDGGVIAVVRDEQMGIDLLTMPKVRAIIRSWVRNDEATLLDALDALSAIAENLGEL
jgi:hypothetical protein